MENWNETSGGDDASARRLVMKSRIALISDHASPLADLGSVDSGGQNVYVAHVASQLARLGYEVDVFTRRDNEAVAEVVEWRGKIRGVHVSAGPGKTLGT